MQPHLRGLRAPLRHARLLPARPRHPRDKAEGRSACSWSQRWILARLRNRRFFSWPSSTRAIAELLLDLNQRPFKKLAGCRASAFEALDRPALQPLPATRYEIGRWKRAKVNIDYHVEFDGHYYSVPHRLVRAKVELRVTATTVEASSGQPARGRHALSHKRGRHTTVRRAHAGVAPRAPGVDPGQADRLGPSHRREHRARSCAGSWSTARTRSRATAPAWACSASREHYGEPGWRPPAPGRWRSARRPTAASTRSSRAGSITSRACSLPPRPLPRAGARERARPRLLPLYHHSPKEIRLMLTEHTLDPTARPRLDGMVHAIAEQATSTAARPGASMTRLRPAGQREIAWRDNRRARPAC